MSAVTNMIYCELSRLPMYIERQYRMVNYWLKILSTENCILKNCYDEMYDRSFIKKNDKQNWCCKIRDILFRYGFNYVWLNQSVVCKDIFLSQLKERMLGVFISEVTMFFENSNKCHLYRYMYSTHTLQLYLDRPVNYIYKPYICKYRISAHILSIETGRYYNVDKNNRLCTNCDTSSIEDEYHFILECKKYSQIREKYIKKYYWRNPSTFKLIQLLSVRNIKELNNLGIFLKSAEKLRI